MAAPTGPMNEDFGRFVTTGSTDPAPNPDPAPAQPDEAARLRSQVAERDATIANLAERPAAAPVAVAALAPIAIPEMGPMPDATTHPVENEAWHRENTVRSERRQDQKVQGIATAAIGEARALSITQELIARHPRYVNMQGYVRTALSGAMADLSLPSLPDDAAALITKAVGNLEAIHAEFDESKAIADAGHVVIPEQNKEPADRSGGVAGGTTATSGRGKKDDEEKVVSMIDAIKDQQSKSGFF